MSANIRQLEWRDESASYRHPDRMAASAYGLGGNYSITGSRKKNAWFWFRNGNWPDGRRNGPVTEEEAKAAAQSDFERRVRECLV